MAQPEPGQNSVGWVNSSLFIGTPPFERANHTGIITNDNKLIIYGGHDRMGKTLNDMVSFDLVQGSWKYIVPNSVLTLKGSKLVSTNHQFHLSPNEGFSPTPRPRAYHTATYYDNKMYVIGGNQSEKNGEVYIFDLKNNIWTVVASSSNPPEVKKPHFRHTACLNGKQIIVFGGSIGASMNSPLMNCLNIFDLDKYKWRTIPNNLPPIHSHSAFVHNNILYVIGGYSENTHNGISAINLSDGSLFHNYDFIPIGFSLHFKRQLLTSTYDPISQTVYILGGYEFNDEEFEKGCADNLITLNFKTRTLTTYTSSDQPPPKCGHSADLWNGKLVIFGGCDRLPVLTGEWIFCDFTNSIWILTPPNGSNLGTLKICNSSF